MTVLRQHLTCKRLCKLERPWQGALARKDLDAEAVLLERLLYKNKNQHRASQHFRRLLEARAWCATCAVTDLPD